MRDSKSQRCIQQHKSLDMTQNATNRDKLINEALKQIFAKYLFKISCKYTKSMLSNWKICFNVLNIRTYDEDVRNLSKIMKLYKIRPVLMSKFEVSKQQQQLQSVIQIRLDQSANFGSLPLNVWVTVSHKVTFNSLNR